MFENDIVDMGDDFQEETEQELLELLDEENIFNNGKDLLIDGDILLYKPCTIVEFNVDTDEARAKIIGMILKHLNELLRQSGCKRYRFMMTLSTNYRDWLVDDYKANRKDTIRPVNLKFIKAWCAQNLAGITHEYLEADDLLAMFMSKNTILWSPDKDLRQIYGTHLDENTRQLVEIEGIGNLVDLGKKTYFTGDAGLFFQMLTGDGTDNIMGCGLKEDKVYKSGAKKGQAYRARVGVGPKAAIKVITQALWNAGEDATRDEQMAAMNQAVGLEYQKKFGANFREIWETQTNLLFMVREFYVDQIPTGVSKMWTHDGRDQYMSVATGEILHDYTPSPNHYFADSYI